MSERIEIEFGSRVRKLREEAGLSSREFALMIGRSKAYIIQLENGHRNVSLDTIERIAAGLGISLTELFKNLDTHVEVGAVNRRTPPVDDNRDLDASRPPLLSPDASAPLEQDSSLPRRAAPFDLCLS